MVDRHDNLVQMFTEQQRKDMSTILILHIHSEEYAVISVYYDTFSTLAGLQKYLTSNIVADIKTQPKAFDDNSMTIVVNRPNEHLVIDNYIFFNSHHYEKAKAYLQGYQLITTKNSTQVLRSPRKIRKEPEMISSSLFKSLQSSVIEKNSSINSGRPTPLISVEIPITK